jgi:hypothetical protein
MPPVENLIFEFASLAVGGGVLIHLWNQPNRFQFIGFFAAMAMTIVVEATGVRETNSYFYGDFLIWIPTSSLSGYLTNVPLFVPVCWAIIMFCFFRLDERLLPLKWYARGLVFALIAVMFDLGLDPIASTSRLVSELNAPCNASLPLGSAVGAGYWTWCIAPRPETELWLGVPLANFYAWFFVIAVFYYFYSAAYQYANNKPVAIQAASLAGAVGVSLFVFFVSLVYLLNLNSFVPGWWILAFFIAIGLTTLAMAGTKRTPNTFDGWSLVAVVSITLLGVGTWLSMLTAHPALILWGGAFFLVSLGLTFWVMRGS